MIEHARHWSRREFLVRSVAGAMTVFMLAGCRNEGLDPTSAPAAPTEPALVEPTPAATAPPPENTPTPEVEMLPQPVILAVEAAAVEAGVDRDDVQVLSFSQRDWPSAALGCPKPGFSYPQVVTPGYDILIRAGSREYNYHSNLRTTVVLCSVS